MFMLMSIHTIQITFTFTDHIHHISPLMITTLTFLILIPSLPLSVFPIIKIYKYLLDQTGIIRACSNLNRPGVKCIRYVSLSVLIKSPTVDHFPTWVVLHGVGIECDAVVRATRAQTRDF